jgi:tripartite-type tricarboxylate transporter receptor subunit TctC
MTDLMGGQVDFMCDQTTNTTPQIKGGKVKAYSVTTAQRIKALPDLPTVQESGIKDFQVGIWHGLWAPKGTPKPVVDKLVAALQTALKDPGVISKFADLGTEPVPQDQATPAALAKHLKAEVEKWAPIIKKAGIYAD